MMLFRICYLILRVAWACSTLRVMTMVVSLSVCWLRLSSDLGGVLTYTCVMALLVTSIGSIARDGAVLVLCLVVAMLSLAVLLGTDGKIDLSVEFGVRWRLRRLLTKILRLTSLSSAL